MKLVVSKHINQHENQEVKLNGWVYNSRRSGRIAFLILRDGFGMIQGIIDKSHVGDDCFDSFKTLSIYLFLTPLFIFLRVKNIKTGQVLTYAQNKRYENMIMSN